MIQTLNRHSPFWRRQLFFLLFAGINAIMTMLRHYMWYGGPNPIWGVSIVNGMGVDLPWAFLGPMVLAFGERVPYDPRRLTRFLAFHLLVMVVIFVPYYALKHALNVVGSLILIRQFPLRHALDLVIGELASDQPRTFLAMDLNLKHLTVFFLHVPLTYAGIILAGETLRYARARRDEEVKAARLAGQLSSARLGLLQRQLHPHFFFNALQAISTLLHRDPTEADRLLVRLSGLLRSMLEDAGHQETSLRTELELTRRYLEIEQIRFQDRLKVKWEIDEALLDVNVPTLMLLPLVENAIRHGLSPKVGSGQLEIIAHRKGSSMIVEVRDDGVGPAPQFRERVGLGNTRERLKALYGELGELDITPRVDGGFVASILLPCVEAHP